MLTIKKLQMQLSLRMNIGTFNGKFTIPIGKIGGQYLIANEYGSQYFRVEEYKRPKFEVKFDPIKGSYSLNDNVTVEGFAKTYSGANLNDVDVKYRVVPHSLLPLLRLQMAMVLQLVLGKIQRNGNYERCYNY